MPLTDPTHWSDLLRRVLGSYDEPLLRQVATRLVKPRNQWPADELIERSLATVGNAAVIDRRLKDLGPCERRLLALIGHSRQPHWKLVNLLEMLAALGHAEGALPVANLFQAGLLYPYLGPDSPRLKNFEQWLGQGAVTAFGVFAHPQVTERALGEDLGLPCLDFASNPGPGTGARQADGLEWPLRLAALWQQVSDNPLRRTQNADFFKRDLDRLRADLLLNGPPSDHLADLPDRGLLAVALGTAEGVLQDQDGELRAATLPPAWEQGLPATLASLWSALPLVEAWDPERGWSGTPPAGPNPYPSAYLLALLLLARIPEGGWGRPAQVGDWLAEHHPFWGGGKKQRGSRIEDRGSKTKDESSILDPRSSILVFLLGLAYQLRLVQAARDAEGEWIVSLTGLGRWLLGVGPLPAGGPAFPQTLLVQPNLEILAYRQGLTPELIARLSRFAAWKNLGSACTLQLQPDSVYRALEAGETFETIVQALDRHGMKPTPTPVVESLKTWANKHERIGVYPAAVLLEFPSAEHLNEALARGLPATRISDKMAVVAREGDVNYQMFRLTGTRDYGLPPDKCVEVEPDGVTLTVDLARSDLMLDTEVQRFAEPLPAEAGRGREPGGVNANGRRQYLLTPASLAAGRGSGLSLAHLENWFLQRTGQPLSPAARLLLTGGDGPPPELRRLHVLTVPTRDVADGLLQWPTTRALIVERLGPAALVVAEENVGTLRDRLKDLGVTVP
jgi:hypothetical protein